jgi:signal transduction protein with GAF and PtsI domain
MFQPRVVGVVVLAGRALSGVAVVLDAVGCPLVERSRARAESI